MRKYNVLKISTLEKFTNMAWFQWNQRFRVRLKVSSTNFHDNFWRRMKFPFSKSLKRIMLISTATAYCSWQTLCSITLKVLLKSSVGRFCSFKMKKKKKKTLLVFQKKIPHCMLKSFLFTSLKFPELENVCTALQPPWHNTLEDF